MTNSKNAGKIIGAVLIGAAVGGILGVLFAPDKGSDTRMKIAEKGKDLKNSLKKGFNSLMGEVKSELNGAKEKATDFAEKEASS